MGRLAQYAFKRGGVHHVVLRRVSDASQCKEIPTLLCPPPFPRSIFEPRVSGDGGLAAVAVVVEQLLALVDVLGRHQDEVGRAGDFVELGLAVSVLAVIEQPAHSAGLFRGVDATGEGRKKSK